MGSEEGDGMANVDVAASWQQYYTWCAPYSHPHSHSHPPPQPHAHSHPHFPHPNHLNQYQQQSLAASTANASAHYSTSQQYHLQLQPSQTPPLHQQQQQQQQFHPVRGQATLRRGSPYERPGIRQFRKWIRRFFLFFFYGQFKVRGNWLHFTINLVLGFRIYLLSEIFAATLENWIT